DEVVEGRQVALGAIAADLVEALVGGAVYLRQDMLWKGVGRTQATGIDAHRKAPQRNGSVGVGVIDVEIIEPAGRSVAAEPPGISLDARPRQQTLEPGDVMRRHLFLHAVGAQTLDAALDVEPGLVKGVAEAGAGIAAHNEAAGLRHERAHMADRATDDDVDSLHGDAATGARVALDHEQAAM